MDKREFIRKSVVGICAASLCPWKSFGEILDSRGSAKPWKWSKEALFYMTTPRGVKCQLCPNECSLGEGETGDCRNRVNSDGILYSIGYGNPCSLSPDPIEKKPFYHFLPSTKAFSLGVAGCNMACLNCQNWQISQSSPRDTRNHDLMPEETVEKAVNYGCRSIAYTYSEPVTFYEYMLDTSKLAHRQGLKNVMVSNGFINEKPLRHLCQFLDAANIDLKSFDNNIYLKLNAGTLKPVLNTLKIMKEEGVWVEITNLVVPGWTDDLDMIREMSAWLYANGLHDVPLHFSRFYPVHKLTQLPSTPVGTLEEAREIALGEGVRHVYIGNVVGTDAGHTYCPACNKRVISRKGYVITGHHLKDGACEYCGEPIAGVWE